MAARIRLCLVSESFYPEVLQGLQIHAYQLTEKLLDLDVECEVLARPVRPETPSEQRAGRILVRHLGVAGQFRGAGPRATLPLVRFVVSYALWLIRQRPRFDVVMALGSKTTPIPALIAKLLAGMPLVVVPQSANEFAEPISVASVARSGPLQHLVVPWQRFRSFMLRQADAVVAISEDTVRSLSLLDVETDRIVRIPNGIDVERFRPVPLDERGPLRASLGLPIGRALFVFVGRLQRAKGVLMLADIWDEVASRHPDAHLVLVGGGVGLYPDDCETELRALVNARGLSERVTFTGSVENVPPYLQAADVFAFPSDSEGFSIALLEAMACGLPVVATAVGGAAELVNDPVHGRLIPPKDKEALRAAIHDIYARRADWPVMGAAARATVIDRYSMDKVAALYASVLNKVAASRHS